MDVAVAVAFTAFVVSTDFAATAAINGVNFVAVSDYTCATATVTTAATL